MSEEDKVEDFKQTKRKFVERLVQIVDSIEPFIRAAESIDSNSHIRTLTYKMINENLSLLLSKSLLLVHSTLALPEEVRLSVNDKNIDNLAKSETQYIKDNSLEIIVKNKEPIVFINSPNSKESITDIKNKLSESLK